MWKNKDELHGGLGSLETPGSLQGRPGDSSELVRLKGRWPHLTCAFNAKLLSQDSGPRVPEGRVSSMHVTRPHHFLQCSPASLPPTRPVAKSAFQETSISSWTARDIETLRCCASEQLRAHGLGGEARGLRSVQKELMWGVVPTSTKGDAEGDAMRTPGGA